MVGCNDPTVTDVLKRDKDLTVSDPDFIAFRERLKHKRVSLVLSGGGGKGAYQAGAMLALLDCEIREFASIAGTSVGALNAALSHELFRTCDRDIVLNLWTTMSRSKVMRASWGIFAKIILYIPLGLFVISDTRAVLTRALPFDIEYHNAGDIAVESLLTLLSILIAVTLSGLFAIGALRIANNVWTPGVAFVVAIVVLPRLFGSLGSRFAAFSNAPLKEAIQSIKIDAVCQQPPLVVCTVATEVSLFSFLTRGARPKPFYIALDQEFGTDTAMGVLLQSAAIPEIFGGKPLPGAGVVVDGGVADNTPLLGVFKEKPDVVIVIYLDHRFGRVTAQRLKEKEILRIREIADLKKHDQERDVKGEVDAWCASLEFIPVIPSQSLGNFLTGTLDFSSAGALSRIEMGYRDTLLQIRRLIAS